MVMLTISLNASYGGVAENVSTMSIGLRRLVSCTHKRHRTFGRISSPLLMSTQVIGIGCLPVSCTQFSILS